MSRSYGEPVARLITLGEDAARRLRDWPDYPTEFGLDISDAPELVRILLDPELRFADSDSVEVFSGIHAWRALGQLRAELAIDTLLTLLEEGDEHDDEWALEELPIVFGMIGRAAMPKLQKSLYDGSLNLWTRVAAARSLKEIAEREQSARGDAVASLAGLLGRFAENDPALNAFLVSYLIDLKAVEEAPLIERAYAAGSVEIDIPGDWEDAQIALGLIEERTTPRPLYGFLPPPQSHAPREPSTLQHHAHDSKARRKARRKIAKDSRRKNRRKKK